MDEKGYKKLIVWQKADELAYQIYSITKNFPKEENYGITSQLRRAALEEHASLQNLRQEVGNLLWKFYKSIQF